MSVKRSWTEAKDAYGIDGKAGPWRKLKVTSLGPQNRCHSTDRCGRWAATHFYLPLDPLVLIVDYLSNTWVFYKYYLL